MNVVLYLRRDGALSLSAPPRLDYDYYDYALLIIIMIIIIIITIVMFISSSTMRISITMIMNYSRQVATLFWFCPDELDRKIS